MAARSPITAVLFFANGTARRRLEERPNINVNVKHFTAGAFAGFCYTNVAFIFDLLKVRAQERQDANMSYIKEIKRIYADEGLKGFTRGY